MTMIHEDKRNRKETIKLLFLLVQLLLVFLLSIQTLKTRGSQVPVPETSVALSTDIASEPSQVYPYYLDSKTSPNHLYELEAFNGDYNVDYYNYYQLFIRNLKTGQVSKLFSGDFRTTDWKWTPDNKIAITYNCGTGCSARKTIMPDETTSISDDINGGISKQNGWEIQYARSVAYSEIK